MARHARLQCVLCGLIVVYDHHGTIGSYPSKCSSNGNGDHIRPGTQEAEEAKQIRAAWIRNPMGQTTTMGFGNG